jgi:hypothetical protein
MAPKAKKSPSKSPKMSRGKKIGAVKPLKDISIPYSNLQWSYK